MGQFYLPINCPRAVCISWLLGCHFQILYVSRYQSISSYYFPDSNMPRDQITGIKFVLPRKSFTKMLLGQGAFSSIINCQGCFWWHLVRLFFFFFTFFSWLLSRELLTKNSDFVWRTIILQFLTVFHNDQTEKVI